MVNKTTYYKEEWYTRVLPSGIITVTYHPDKKQFNIMGYPRTLLNQEDILDFIDFCIEMFGHDFYMQLNQLITSTRYNLDTLWPNDIEITVGE